MKTLESFTFASVAANYDWAKLLDGGIYELEAGKDYTCKPVAVTSQARGRCKRMGLKLRSSRTKTGIVIQAVPIVPTVAADKPAVPTTEPTTDAPPAAAPKGRKRKPQA